MTSRRLGHPGCLEGSLGETIKEIVEPEMDVHLGYEKSERFNSDDYYEGS